MLMANLNTQQQKMQSRQKATEKGMEQFGIPKQFIADHVQSLLAIKGKTAKRLKAVLPKYLRSWGFSISKQE